MAELQIGTVNGGITQVSIKGKVTDLDNQLFTSISNISKKLDQMLVDLSEFQGGGEKFIPLLGNLSKRTKIKVITQDKEVITTCLFAGLATFPTAKSASLSYAGDETISLLKSKLQDVPILNTEAYSLLTYLDQPDWNFKKIEMMIKDKPGVCSQILRVANSAYFRRVNKAETLEQALVTLGCMTLRQMFYFNFYFSVGNLFKAQKEVIQHGQDCSFLADYICKSAGGSPEECAKVRMGGLLHDVGSQALAFFFPKQYEKVKALIKKESKISYLAELLVFGTEHQSIGSILASKWNFPNYLSGVIGDHHYMQSDMWNILTLPVFIANNFLHEREWTPFVPYYQKLEGYFFLKKKDPPWKDIFVEFSEALAEKTGSLDS